MNLKNKFYKNLIFAGMFTILTFTFISCSPFKEDVDKKNSFSSSSSVSSSNNTDNEKVKINNDSNLEFNYDKDNKIVNINFGDLFEDEEVTSVDLYVKFKSNKNRYDLKVTCPYENKGIISTYDLGVNKEKKYILCTLKNPDIKDNSNFPIKFEEVGNITITDIQLVDVQTNLGEIYNDSSLYLKVDADSMSLDNRNKTNGLNG